MENKTGVYIGMLVAQESKIKLLDFCKKIGLSLADSYNKMEDRLHSTIIYSKMGCAKTISLEDVSIKVNSYKWDVLTSELTGNTCLVLSLDSSIMEDIHYSIKTEHNLAHAFDCYCPHISIHYNYTGEIPNELPDFEIELEDIYVKDLIFTTPTTPKTPKTIV